MDVQAAAAFTGGLILRNFNSNFRLISDDADIDNGNYDCVSTSLSIMTNSKMISKSLVRKVMKWAGWLAGGAPRRPLRATNGPM